MTSRRAGVVLLLVALAWFVGALVGCRRTPLSSTSAVVDARDSRGAPSDGVVTSLPGLDTAALSRAEQEMLWAVANDELSPCGDPHSLAVCARDNVCATCARAMRFLVARVQDGFPREALGEIVHARYAPDVVVNIRTGEAPVRGPAQAPVTLVEFSDYECPHCGRLAPILREVEAAYPTQVRVIHMHYPLPLHPHAAPAARAAVAAGRQGKFWEYHDLLFAHQTALDPANLEQYATQLGLDLTRFRADVHDAAVDARVQADRREGERLQVNGTPTLYLNGRLYHRELPMTRAALGAWIEEEAAAAAVH